MDLIIILVVIAAIGFFFRDFKFVVYGFGVIEIFFRIVNFIANHIGIKEVANFINKYIPASLIDVVGKYSNGLLYDVLVWILVIMFCCFEFYLVKYFIKRK